MGLLSTDMSATWKFCIFFFNFYFFEHPKMSLIYTLGPAQDPPLSTHKWRHFPAAWRLSWEFLPKTMNFPWNPPRGCLQCKHSVFTWRHTPKKCPEEVPPAPAAPRWEYFVLFPADPSVISVNICSEEQQTKFLEGCYSKLRLIFEECSLESLSALSWLPLFISWVWIWI